MRIAHACMSVCLYDKFFLSLLTHYKGHSTFSVSRKRNENSVSMVIGCHIQCTAENELYYGRIVFQGNVWNEILQSTLSNDLNQIHFMHVARST